MTICLVEVKKAAEELLSEADSKALIEELQSRARAKAAQQATTYEQALRDAADDMAKEVDRDLMLAKYQQYKNMVKRFDRLERYKSFGNDLKAMKSITVGVASGKGAKTSTALLQRKITNELLGGFNRDLKKAGVLEVFNSKEHEIELAKELFSPGSVKNPDIAKVAEIYKKWNDIARKMANAEGADIGKLEEYMGRQSHNAELMKQPVSGKFNALKERIDYFKERKAKGLPYDHNHFYEKAYQRWRSFIEPRLDPIKTFGDADKEKFLRSVYDNLISGIHNKEISVDERLQKTYAFKGPGNLAKKLGSERKLHFKDGVSFFEYNKEFGYGSMHENLLRGFESYGHDIGLMRVWGTNPEAAFKADLREMQENPENKRNPKMKMLMNNNKMQQFFDTVSGLMNSPANAAAAKTASNIRAWKSMSSLGLTTLRSIPDVAKRAAQMHASTGQTFMTAMRDSVIELTQGKAKGELEEISDLTNVWAKGVHDNVRAKFSSPDAPGAFTAKATQTFFKFNLMHWWDEALTKSTGIGISRNLANMRELSFEKLHPNAQYEFELYGIGEKEWDLIRSSPIKNAGGQAFITADATKSISDESIANYLNSSVNELKPFQIEQVKNKINDLVGSYITDQAALVIPDNQANVRRFMLQGTRGGTVVGELLRFVGQFKAFTLDFTMNVLGRDVGRLMYRIQNAENFGDMLTKGAGDIWGIAQLIGWSSALWYVGNAAADISKGKTPRPLSSPATWAAALAGGGGLGIYGDFLFGEYLKNRFGSSFVETAAGPVAGEISQLTRVLADLKNGDDPTASTMQFLKNNTPFINLFYTRIALDYAILYGIQERVSPGSLRRMENKLKNEQEQEFIFQPSQYALGR